eukprot:11506072-Alexandrium_andersonii.AAC.1
MAISFACVLCNMRSSLGQRHVVYAWFFFVSRTHRCSSHRGPLQQSLCLAGQRASSARACDERLRPCAVDVALLQP